MLVVIAIIALLASILIPSITGALARAKKVQCMNNLKGIGGLLTSYAIEHGHMPPTQTYQGGFRNGWASRLSDFAFEEAFAEVDSEADAIQFYENGPGKIFRCPSDDTWNSKHSKSYLGVLYTMGCTTEENPRISNAADWRSEYAGPAVSRSLDQLTSKMFLVVEQWMGYSSSCGGNTRMWDSGCDVKGWPTWHFHNFPAHGTGSINRQQGEYDPLGHRFVFNVLHGDGHVASYISEPGSSARGDEYWGVPE
jgi:type II secretory pathway pseudopilin PulG